MVPDREKVIKGLEYCIDYAQRVKDFINDALFKDAITLLKAQDNTICTKERCPMNASTISDDCNVKTCPWRTEAVVPKLANNRPWFECPVCGKHLLSHEDRYCSGCGKRVKWNDD